MSLISNQLFYKYKHILKQIVELLKSSIIYKYTFNHIFINRIKIYFVFCYYILSISAMGRPKRNFESEDQRRLYIREYQREYRRNYRTQRREQRTDSQIEEQKRKRNQADRERYAKKKKNPTVDHFEVQNSEDTSLQRNEHQMTLAQTSNSQGQERQEDHVETNETTHAQFNETNQLNDEHEKSVSIDCVPETRQQGNSLQMNLGVQCRVHNVHSCNNSVQFDFKRFQMQFRSQLDSFRTPKMCYVCQESYIGIKVSRSSEGPICNRCRQERGIHRFSCSNNLDPGPQAEILSKLTQVEEMLIARVSPILQVTHATGGQYKYKGHTISFPQNVQQVSKILPHTIQNLPIIIVRRRNQRGTDYNFTVNRDRVYNSLRYKIEHDKFYSDVIIDNNALNDLPRNTDENVFSRLTTVQMEFDSDTNELTYVGPLLEIDEGNTIEHTTSMASKPPNAQREMELIQIWVNNLDAKPTTLIDVVWYWCFSYQ